MAVDGVELIGPAAPADRLPHLVCLGVHGVEAEPVLIGLDRSGVAVHSGSACSSESIEPSPVLEAMGVDPSHSLRVSVGWTTTESARSPHSPRPSSGSSRTSGRSAADGTANPGQDVVAVAAPSNQGCGDPALAKADGTGRPAA